jgi:hypothetical protein
LPQKGIKVRYWSTSKQSINQSYMKSYLSQVVIETLICLGAALIQLQVI